MISISGIKYQKQLEALPYFNKNQASILIGKTGKNLDKKLEQLKKIGYLLSLKKGTYASVFFYEKTEKRNYIEYIANILRSPSYISLEYVLQEYGLIPEANYSISAITIKSSRTFKNFLGNFIYKNIKNDLFVGFNKMNWTHGTIYKATKAKALFDFLYLKPFVDSKQEIISDLRINWNSFEKKDVLEFEKYTKMSKSVKMASILKIMNTVIYVS